MNKDIHLEVVHLGIQKEVAVMVVWGIKDNNSSSNSSICRIWSVQDNSRID